MWIIKAICLVPYPHTSHTVNNNDFPNKKVFQDKVASHLEFHDLLACTLRKY